MYISFASLPALDLTEGKDFASVTVFVLPAPKTQFLAYNWYSDISRTKLTSEILMIELSKVTATAKSLQSCPTLCDPIPGILQARTLEWVAISFSNA